MPWFIRSALLDRGIIPESVMALEFDWQRNKGMDVRVKIAPKATHVNIEFHVS